MTTALTSYYSLRLFLYTFIDLASFSSKVFAYIHESDMILLFPLVVLVFGTIFIGFIFKDFFLGVGSDSFSDFIFMFPSYSFFIETELLYYKQKIFLFVFFIFFSIGFFFLLLNFSKNFFSIFSQIKNLNLALFNIFYNKAGFEFFLFLNIKWGFDFIYNNFINKNLLFIFYFHLYELFDKVFLERFFGHFAILKTSFFFSKVFRLFFQNGVLFFYLFFFFIIFVFNLNLIIFFAKLLWITEDEQCYFGETI